MWKYLHNKIYSSQVSKAELLPVLLTEEHLKRFIFQRSLFKDSKNLGVRGISNW